MKLHELREAMRSKGTYAAVRFCENTTQAIVDYMHEAEIPNMLDKEQLHSTLLYSRKHCPDYQPADPVSYMGTPNGFEIWDTDAPGGVGKSRCLVLTYDCPDLVERHQSLRAIHGATHDFETYDPHITLSYDIGDMDESQFPDIRKHLGQINIVKEYSEDLDLN